MCWGHVDKFVPQSEMNRWHYIHKLLKVLKNCSKNFANRNVGLPIVEKIWWKSGGPFWVSLWILYRYKMPGVEPTGFIPLLEDLSIISLCFNSIRSEVILFSRLIMWLIFLPAGTSRPKKDSCFWKRKCFFCNQFNPIFYTEFTLYFWWRSHVFNFSEWQK